MKSIQRGIYPGTFDPVTFGHIDLIERASKIFDKVIVAVAHSKPKGVLFSVEERVDMLEDAVKGIKNVTVDDFNGLVVEYVRKTGANVMIRGLRMLSDFEYEFQMALTNRKLSEDVETIFMMPSESYAYVSARLLKEAGAFGADLAAFMPPFVASALRRKLQG